MAELYNLPHEVFTFLYNSLKKIKILIYIYIYITQSNIKLIETYI